MAFCCTDYCGSAALAIPQSDRINSRIHYSILGCVLPLQEVALRQSPLSFSVLCYPCPYRSLLPTMSSLKRRYGLPTDLTPFICHSVLLVVHLLSFRRATCPAHFPFRIGYALNYVTVVLCLMMVLRTPSFSLTLSIFLSIARWLVSSFLINAFVRDHVWHPYIIAGKTHWLKTFLFRLTGRCLSRKISLYFPKTLHPHFILIETSCFALFSIAIVCPRHL